MKHYLAGFLIFSGFVCSCKSLYSPQKSEEVFYTPGKSVSLDSDSAVLSQILPYKQKLDVTMNEVLAVSATTMEKGQPESKLGNFVADLCLATINEKMKKLNEVPADFCVLNNGGLRSSLPAGNITLENIFELMPFENELVVVELKGIYVEKLLQYISEKGGVPVSNLTMKIDSGKYSQVLINGIPFDPQLNYRILTSDYLANGGDSMSMFGENLKNISTGIKVRDAIIEFMRKKNQNGELVNSETDGRISK